MNESLDKLHSFQKQSEALRLADCLTDRNRLDLTCDEAAAELRRLHAVNQELLGALRNVTVHLIAAHSLLQRGGKKAAASNTIFSMMLADYEKSFEVGRAAVAKATGGAA